jgi:lipopolysaccharide export system protein LptC
LTIASRIDGATSGSFPTSHRRDHIGRDHIGRETMGRDHQRAVRVALRHSRLVRIMRVGIPACLLLAAAAFGVFHWLDPMRVLAKLPVGTDGVVLSGSKIIMRQPRLNGYTKDERPYLVTARSAAKDLTNPDMLELDDIKTTIAIPGGGNVEVTASQGLYSGKAETIRLQRNVLVSSSEYEVSLREALVDVRAGSVVSEQPVEVRMLQGTISANRLEVRESGAVIRFDGGVTLVIDRGDAPLNIGAAP